MVELRLWQLWEPRSSVYGSAVFKFTQLLISADICVRERAVKLRKQEEHKNDHN